MLSLPAGRLLSGDLRPELNTAANDAPVLRRGVKLLKVITRVRLASVASERAAVLSVEVVGEVVPKVVVLKGVLSSVGVVFQGKDVDGST